jgi:hypothetical protein
MTDHQPEPGVYVTDSTRRVMNRRITGWDPVQANDSRVGRAKLLPEWLRISYTQGTIAPGDDWRIVATVSGSNIRRDGSTGVQSRSVTYRSDREPLDTWPEHVLAYVRDFHPATYRIEAR